MDKSKLAVSTYNKIADIYTKFYFNDLSDRKYIDKFLQFMPINSKILDIGCGPGQFTKYILEKGYHIQGIDLSNKMLTIAQSKVPDAKFVLMDMRKLDYKPDTFDGLLVAYSLIHIPTFDLIKTLDGFRKVLKKGGHMLLITQKGLPDKLADEPLMKGEKIFVNFFTEEKINKYITKTGFETIYQKEVGSADPGSISDKIIYTIAKK